MAIPTVEKKMYKMSLEYLAVTDSEEAIQDYWGIELPYGLEILLLHPRNQNICPPRNLYINVHRSSMITKKWKQLKCPSTDKWIYKMWYNGSLQEK